jgi:hypothetical protein
MSIRTIRAAPQAPTADIEIPKKRGPKPKPLVEFPEPKVANDSEPAAFGDALKYHMDRHAESCFQLHRAIVGPGEAFDRKTLRDWASGAKLPRTTQSFRIIARVERRYRLEPDALKSKVVRSGRAITHDVSGITASERRRLAWHLPDDFGSRGAAEQSEILEWIRTVIISGSTDYRRFQAEAMKTRYALRFPTVAQLKCLSVEPARQTEIIGSAPVRLGCEIADLVRFKSNTLTAIGEKRNGVWGDETIAQITEHLGLLYGALSACPNGPIAGAGIELDKLSLAVLVFPRVWDWYLRWREGRRGFYTRWEVNMLAIGLSLTRRETGWLWQNPGLANCLSPIPGFVTEDEVFRARSDWEGTCETMHQHGLARSKEIKRVARVHRDPFEPILPLLEAESPVGEYRKITNEILDRMPDTGRFPRAAAEAVRGFLMLRLGLHLGLRQKNLRQLLLCPRGQFPRSERQLELLKCGEFRWNNRESGWEVLIPALAFKNANSSFFGKKPFRLVLPDLDGLYVHIERYVENDRSLLLGGANDPGTFFVKTVKRTSSDAAYNQNTFYEAWRLIIQRYGIYNPYTGMGAIRGLLPHGPHNVRDILATHILKKTGSYEQASYAIQDTPEMVADHYGRTGPGTIRGYQLASLC